MAAEYKTGVCNIGSEEVKYRKRIVGYGGAVVAVALYFILVFFNFSLLLYLILLIPIFISVHGFNEAKYKFCTSYARSGRYNMTSEVGMTQNVLSRAKRDKDRQYANKLIQKSLRISLLITIILIALSRLANSFELNLL